MNIEISRFGKKICTLLFFLFVISLFCAAAGTAQSQKIVVFKKSFDSRISQDNVLRRSGALKIKSLKLINGAVVHLTPQTERVLKNKSEILRIDEDIFIYTSQIKSKNKNKTSPDQPIQKFPWNMLMIGADLAWPQTQGDSVRVAVLDTGIDLDHPDLFENIKGNINIINSKKSGDDDSGHGTHVAGIIAAVDNAIGVIGVGPEIDLFAVKVLDKKGRGRLSDLIDAFDWCIDNNIHIINMSLGSPQDNASFHETIKKAYLAGIVQISAAGNYGLEGGVISFPARYPETIAVSSVDQFGNMDPFSSYGDEIDLAAPGVEVWATFKDGSYVFMSGTSMAAPHVTGTVALIFSAAHDSQYDVNHNGIWEPSEILMKLSLTTLDLGLSHEQQGAGLVRADEAIR
ncbi:S8 family peptidase [Acidobacteriota bacterium]